MSMLQAKCKNGIRHHQEVEVEEEEEEGGDVIGCMCKGRNTGARRRTKLNSLSSRRTRGSSGLNKTRHDAAQFYVKNKPHLLFFT